MKYEAETKYYDVIYEGNVIIEQEPSVALALAEAEEYLENKCCEGEMDFGVFDIELRGTTEDGDLSGVYLYETITIEDQPTDLEEHSIYNAHDLGVRCGKSF